jgi:hypothetical protein
MSMNLVRSRLDANWEYVGYDLSYPEFKAQVNLYVKNRRHALKILIESSGNRHNDCVVKHWESMIHLITFEAKQNKAHVVD